MLVLIFLLSLSGHVLASCKDIQCNGDPNAVPSDCPSFCPPTCDEPDTSDLVCPAVCDPNGCVCKPGFILTKKGGICIKPEECPEKTGCNGDPNAIANDCPSSCPPTCDEPDTSGKVCTLQCDPSGCVCKPGFILTEKGGKCIKVEECPGKISCNGDPNAIANDCPSSCPPTCVEPDTSGKVCTLQCDPSGCVCKPGFVLTEKGGKCVKPEECPGREGCNGDRNAVVNDCPSSCPPTCDEPDTSSKVCTRECDPSGCMCKPGFILTEKGGKCVKSEACPEKKGCNGDPNATATDCPSSCPPTCDEPDTSGKVCTRECGPSRCACKPGFILTKKGGKCVKPEKCPEIECKGDPNAIFKECPSYCPPTCDDPKPGDICPAACNPSRCVCKPGYILTKIGGKCVQPEECPKKTGCKGDPNAIPKKCPSSCPPTCDEPDTSGKVCTLQCEIHGCECKPGYILTKKGGKCVKPNECPADHLQCGHNETAVKCRTICPPQNCEISYTDYKCDKYQNICEPGCDCLPNYLRNGSGICILNNDCPYPTSPICGINEIARDCRKICPPQTCLSRKAFFKCVSDIPCEPGCDCVPNYLRNNDGICIPAKQCDSPNETCSVSQECIRTCASPNPPNCTYTPTKTNIDGCNCKEGFILSDVGSTCIKIEECPNNLGCNGDMHARPKVCPLPYPSTCDSPDVKPCNETCEPIGCECEPGYLLSSQSGKCILPDECPGGNPCPENAEFRACKYNCPQDYCPENEDTATIVCDPFPICLSGCACKLNHKLLSNEDERCVVASECPPVNCTRPNEVWDGCPSECFSGTCEDRAYQNTVCNTLLLNCQPKCVCRRDTFRNASGICVPASECCELF